jgi:hypothetical protein
MVVNAYLLPETFNEIPTVEKSFSKKRIVFGVETDVSGDLFSNPLLYNEYAQVIDFIAVRGSQMAEFVNATTAKLTNVKLPILPVELRNSFDVENWFQVYINGAFQTPSVYAYNYDSNLKEIIFTFTIAFELDENDEIAITGKFIEL